MTNIVLLSVYITTNTVSGFWTSPDGVEVSKGVYASKAVAVWVPERTKTVTNYTLGFVVGTNKIAIATISQ